MAGGGEATQKGFKPLSLAFISAGLPGRSGQIPTGDGRGLLGNGSGKSGLPQGRLVGLRGGGHGGVYNIYI